MSEFSISSPDFEDGGEIPKKFGYKHGNVNPTLKIRMPPEARSIVLIMDDPDALEVVGRVWVHWVMWNICSRKDDKIKFTEITEFTIPSGTNEKPLTEDEWDAVDNKEETENNKHHLFTDHQARYGNPTPYEPLAGALDGLNDFKEFDYGGPAPPDKKHTYIFKAYALDIAELSPDDRKGTKTSVENAMTGHILAEAKLTGTFAP